MHKWISGLVFVCLSSTFSLAQELGLEQMVKIKAQLYMDQSEIANIHWQEYLHDLKKDSSQAFYESQWPDAQLNQHEGGSLFAHPAYRFKPVMGISYAQVQNFCRWRSEKVNALLRKKNPHYKGYWVFRLPQEAEWVRAASGGKDPGRFPYGSTPLEIIDPKAPMEMHPPRPNVNFRQHAYKAFSREEIFSQEAPNAYGFYHIIGNLAEMLATEGLAKGGSWHHRRSQCPILLTQRYFGPEKWLGFRCVAQWQEQSPFLEEEQAAGGLHPFEHE